LASAHSVLTRSRTGFVPNSDTIEPEHNKVCIQPGSVFNLSWEMFSVCLVFYDLITLPLAVFAEEEENAFLLAMTWIIRIWWTGDLVISFNTGFVNDTGTLVMNRFKVARNYGFRQLPFDALVVIFDWAEMFWDLEGSSVAKSGRLLRVARLVRLKKVRSIMKQLANYVRSEKLSVLGGIVRYLLILAIFMHFIACGWYGVGRVCHDEGQPTWVTETVALPTSTIYIRSLHFAVSLFHGEVTIAPRNDTEFIVLALLLYTIFCTNVWLLSTITTGLTRLELISTRRTAMFQALDRYISLNNVSHELATKVQGSAFKALAAKEQTLPESEVELLQMISVPLRMELAFEIHLPSLAVHPFFACYADINPGGIRKVCIKMNPLTISADDYVFNENERASADGDGDRGARMFFVVSGKLTYFKPSNTFFEAVEVSNKQWLSEAVLWADDWRHCGSLKAVTDCQLLTLTAEDFRHAVSSFNSNHATLYGESFVEDLDSLGYQNTDVGECGVELDTTLRNVFDEEWPTHRALYYKSQRATTRGSMVRGSMMQRASVGIFPTAS